jgi:hypothetical protein
MIYKGKNIYNKKGNTEFNGKSRCCVITLYCVRYYTRQLYKQKYTRNTQNEERLNCFILRHYLKQALDLTADEQQMATTRDIFNMPDNSRSTVELTYIVVHFESFITVAVSFMH